MSRYVPISALTAVCLLDKPTEVELQGAIEANGLNKEVVAGVKVDPSSVA